MSLCSVAVLLREDGDRASAEMVCAGHPLPLLIRKAQAAPVGRFSPMLGAYDVEDWCRTTIALEPLDVLVLYTDGVFDAVGADGRFGEERLRATLMGRAHAQDAVGRIDAALSAFEVGPQADDTAVLAVQRVGVAAQRVAAPGSRRAPATTRTGHDRPGAPRRLPHARRVARRRRRRRAQVRADGRDARAHDRAREGQCVVGSADRG